MTTNGWNDQAPIARMRIGLADTNGRLRALLGTPLAVMGSVVAVDAADAPPTRDCDVLVCAAEDAASFVTTSHGPPMVLVVPFGDIDRWSDAIGIEGVALVPDDDPEGVLQAVARTRRRRGGEVHDPGGDDAPRRLRELAIEVGRIAEALGALGPGAAVADRRPAYREGPAEGTAVAARDIRAMIRARRLRDQFFPPDIFADPAWDILLDLMAARLEERDVAVSSLCIAAAVPPTTALRWIGMMTESGMLVRAADPADRRRVFIRLSEDSARRLDACLRALLAAGAPVA